MCIADCAIGSGVICWSVCCCFRFDLVFFAGTLLCAGSTLACLGVTLGVATDFSIAILGAAALSVDALPPTDILLVGVLSADGVATPAGDTVGL